MTLEHSQRRSRDRFGRYAKENRPDVSTRLDDTPPPASVATAHQLLARTFPFDQRDQAAALIDQAATLDLGQIVDLGEAWEQSVLAGTDGTRGGLNAAAVRSNPVTQASLRCREAVDTAGRKEDYGRVMSAAGMVTAERMPFDPGLQRNATMAARNAMEALYARDLVDRPGSRFSRDDYELLTGPWRRSIGPVHPDDPA